MFTYIKLKNFKSFGDIFFNLCDRQGNPKKMMLIYGENGAGKTNLVSSLLFLSESAKTMNIRDLMQALLDERPELEKNEDFLSFFRAQCKDLEALIREYKMISTDESMYLEFGFTINNHGGCYILETNNNQLIHERLEFTITKNRGIYYDIKPDKTSINPKVFADKAVYMDILQSCRKFWGKHSLLSIVSHEIEDKADAYIKNGLSKSFFDVLKHMNTISCTINLGSNYERPSLTLPLQMLDDFDKGTIPLDMEEQLTKTEIMLNSFFKTTSRDIKKLYYKCTYKEDSIRYRLMSIKRIAGKDREIAFSLESAGMKTLLNLLPSMLVSVYGTVAIIDEFEIGLHDLLVKEIILALHASIKGQLILTTHNTNLMNSGLPKECFYIINEKNDGYRSVNPITCNHKIHKNTSIQNQYLTGQYTGIPDIRSLDFLSLLNDLGMKY